MYELDESYEEVRQEAIALATAAAEYAGVADEMSTVHPAVLRLVAESGLWSLMVPARFGGRFASVDPLAVTIVREALMASSAHADSLFALQGIGSYAVTVGGSAELQAEWLPRVLSGEALAALALTEPHAGSDLRSITTELVSDGASLRLRGRKAFISNAGAAAFYTVFAREGDGYSAVLVPADAPGLTITPTAELIAPHVLGDLEFDDVLVSPEARLGSPGRGFGPVLSTLSVFRVSVAGAAVGLAQAALEEGARHARDRHQFGKPLAEHGAVGEMIADSWAEIEASRLLTYRAATEALKDPRAALTMSSIAKLHASETAGRVVDRSMQMMGRFGLVKGTKMERLYREARAMRVYEGSSEVLRSAISRSYVRDVLEA